MDRKQPKLIQKGKRKKPKAKKQKGHLRLRRSVTKKVIETAIERARSTPSPGDVIVAGFLAVGGLLAASKTSDLVKRQTYMQASVVGLGKLMRMVEFPPSFNSY